MAYTFRLIFFLLAICSCTSSSFRGKMRIGVDPKWYPLEFGPQTAYVNGYTEELLLEMARYSGMEFELIEANWDTLVDGLKEKKYDAILSSLPPYEYNMAKFDFSKNFLDLGPVLILRTNEKEKALDQMKGKMIGIISGDQSALLLGKCVVREYRSIPALLNGVAVGEIDGALLSQIPAVNFVKDLYANQLKIVGLPLTEAGLHLVALKGKGNSFNKTLQSMKKNKAVEKLLKKWNLS